MVSQALAGRFNTEICPIFAIGDSWDNDGAMMRLVCNNGGMGICINPKERPNWAGDFNIHSTEIK
ncbi:MAG: hypothetical protein HRU09_03950 [Oligoflexales bacterium]|nr:hypothetical protein [Oligoflexales bacterium]